MKEAREAGSGPNGSPTGYPTPLETLFDSGEGEPIALPGALRGLYGELRFPTAEYRPHVYANFASTLDGVVALGGPTPSGGAEITGRDPHDRFVLALLRAAADVIVVGAGTLRASPRHRWSAERAMPVLAAPLAEMRRAAGGSSPARVVVVSARGDLDLGLPIFGSADPSPMIVTTPAGAQRLASAPGSGSVPVATVAEEATLPPASILRAIVARGPCRRILVEGGPRLMGEFLAGGAIDELFLTLAPQVAGRAAGTERPGFADGRLLAPSRPTWGRLLSLKRGGSHLFLRYDLGPVSGPP